MKDDGFVKAIVTNNMCRMACDEVAAAAVAGTDLVISHRVYINDGSRNWPTALATALCRNPERANGTREDMAEIIDKELNTTMPFNAYRLSKDLSGIARKAVVPVLKEYGYGTANLDTGLSIRDIVRAGKLANTVVSRTMNTQFDIDGLWLDSKFYPYERLATYETGSPWYELGIRVAGDLIQLKTVLTMRAIGIAEFIGLDEEAQRRASAEQIANRAAMTKTRRAA